MADVNGGSDAILADSNFKTLAFSKTPPDEFSNLVATHVAGYVQRKHLLDGLKSLKGKVEAAENKQKVVRNVGKAKQLDPEDEALCKLYDSFDIADKIKSLNQEVQAMLDEGRVTSEEKPLAIEHIKSRRDAAKAADKAKLLERAEKQLDAVVKAKNTIQLPVANAAEIYALQKRLQFIHRLEKRQVKTLDEDEREVLHSKAKVQAEADSLEVKSRMWFESDHDFKPRLERALVELAKSEAEDLKRAEAEALEKQRKAEELALEQKRLEAQKKEEEHHKQLMDKLEAKRQEAQARPLKEAPKAKPKEKKKVIALDPQSLFQNAHLQPVVTPEPSPEASEAGDGEDWEEQPAAAAPAPAPAAPAPAAAPKAKVPEPKPRQPRPPKPVLENKWGAPPVCPDYPEEVEDALLDEIAGPSLAEALTAPKPAFKKPVQPAKPEKKTWAKIDPHELFQPPSREAHESDDDLRALPVTSVEDEPAPAEPEPAAAPEAAAAPAPEPAPEAKAEPAKPKPRPPKPVIENKWDTPASAPEASEDADEDVGPSLADAAVAAKAAAKKTPPPQPKKKEKKKFTKVSAVDLGFDASNPNYA